MPLFLLLIILLNNVTMNEKIDTLSLKETFMEQDRIFPDSSVTGYVFIGDSRTVGMNNVCNIEQEDNCFVIAELGMGYTWLINDAVLALEQIKEDNPNIKYWNIISNLGVNDLNNISNYIEVYNEFVSEGNILYLLSVNPIEGSSLDISNEDINSFNDCIRSIEGSIYLDCYSYLTENGFLTKDNLHYTDETYINIFDYVKGNLIF